MVTNTEKIENKKVEDAEKDRELDTKYSSIKSEKIDEQDWWNDKTRGKYIKKNREDAGSGVSGIREPGR